MRSVSERAMMMELNEKLQELRKRKGLTQEELAEALYVSRTAISKWESGRGYPNIDSLKAIAKYFSVTIDELLSGDQVLTIAREEQKQKQAHARDLIFGLLDCSVAMLLFLPFFGQKMDGIIYEVSLLSLTEITPYLKVAYWVAVLGVIMTGVLTLALQNCGWAAWLRSKMLLSLVLSAATGLLFIMSLQPYAAVLVLVFLAIKVFVWAKWQ